MFNALEIMAFLFVVVVFLYVTDASLASVCVYTDNTQELTKRAFLAWLAAVFKVSSRGFSFFFLMLDAYVSDYFVWMRFDLTCISRLA